MPRVDGKWDGGYIRRDAGGKKVFCIRRMIHGIHYDVSTRCSTTAGAMAELRRFEENPATYEAGGTPLKEPILLDEHLVKEYLDYSASAKENSTEWLSKKRRYLGWWADQLKGLDLKSDPNSPHPGKVSLTRDIIPALGDVTAHQHRIAIIKGLYTWLRSVTHRVSPAEDPTLKTLPVPQAAPQQWKFDKAIPMASFKAAKKNLKEQWLWALIVQAGTGWHVTETLRFAQRGAVGPAPKHKASKQAVGGVLSCPQTKGGEILNLAVSPEVAEAGKRLLKYGGFSIVRYRAAIRAACKQGGVPPFTPGRFRHTVATNAISKGSHPELVSSYLNHTAPSAIASRRRASLAEGRSVAAFIPVDALFVTSAGGALDTLFVLRAGSWDWSAAPLSNAGGVATASNTTGAAFALMPWNTFLNLPARAGSLI